MGGADGGTAATATAGARRPGGYVDFGMIPQEWRTREGIAEELRLDDGGVPRFEAGDVFAQVREATAWTRMTGASPSTAVTLLADGTRVLLRRSDRGRRPLLPPGGSW